jgi:hypothetical protein
MLRNRAKTAGLNCGMFFEADTFLGHVVSLPGKFFDRAILGRGHLRSNKKLMYFYPT